MFIYRSICIIWAFLSEYKLHIDLNLHGTKSPVKCWSAVSNIRSIPIMPEYRETDHPMKCVRSERFLAGQHTFVDKTAITSLLYVHISVYIFRIGPKKAGFNLFTDKHLSIYE